MRVFNSKITEFVGDLAPVLPQHQSNVFIGLTLMGVKCGDIGAIWIQAINHSLQYNLGFGNAQQMSNIIHS
jgi:hypothetical protein